MDTANDTTTGPGASQPRDILDGYRYTRPRDYMGPDYFDCYHVIGQHRDSDALTRSNFRSFLAALGGESDTVRVIRDSHWAVGWVETLYVTMTDTTACDKARQILKDFEAYPVIDEEDYSTLGWEEGDCGNCGCEGGFKSWRTGRRLKRCQSCKHAD